ncbi:MAG: mannosyl-3-phosphoglycerate synthase [Dehalococcoidia bacterium]|nr:mannosyl-3-phosphoglycerate synthase [Dehalococcoidia bacterium]
MRIEAPRYTERFGAVRINEVQKVLELDSGRARKMSLHENIAVRKIEEDTLKDFEEKLAIVIPVRNEKLKLFEGVISGVPHECLTIVISNSDTEKVDRFRMEKDTLKQYCHFTRRNALIIHQKDPVVARALEAGGYTDILDEDGLVRNGKAEGMLLAMMISMMVKKQFIGFIDADNFFPGSVWEYVRCYAAGFSMAQSQYSMVRVVWRYKPKASAGMHFRKWGRVSEITNKCMNSLISVKTGFDTEIIKTGNAGEHAISLKLAEILPYASGYAVEPQEFVAIFEGFGGVLPLSHQTGAKQGVEVFQIETRNPHLHEDRGTDHLQGMLVPGLGAIYHSKLCDSDTKQLVINELAHQKAIQLEEEPTKPRTYRPPKVLNLKKFAAVVEEHMASYYALNGQ